MLPLLVDVRIFATIRIRKGLTISIGWNLGKNKKNVKNTDIAHIIDPKIPEINETTISQLAQTDPRELLLRLGNMCTKLYNKKDTIQQSIKKETEPVFQ